MKKQYKAPWLEVLELVADESICLSGESYNNEGDTEIPGDDFLG